MPDPSESPAAQPPLGDYAEMRVAAFAGVRVLLARHLAVGLLSALGTLYIIRELGPADWGVFAVAYLHLISMDALVSRGVIVGLARRSFTAEPPLISSAARLVLYAGLALVGATALFALAISPFYSPPELTLLLAANAACTLLFAARALPSTLLERRLEYGPIAAADVTATLAFLAVALPGVALGYGLEALAFAILARGAASFAVIRLRLSAPLLGTSAGPGARRLLPFGLPLCALLVLAAIDGLVAPFAIGSHETELGFLLVSATILGYGVAVVVAITRVALPGLSALRGSELAHSARRAVAVSGFLTLSVLVPAGGLAQVWAEPVLGGAWEDGVAYMQLGAVALMASALIGVLSGALLAHGHPRTVLRVHLGVVASYVAATVVLVAVIGPLGAAIALTGSRWLYAGLLVRAARSRLGVSLDWASVNPYPLGLAALGLLVLASAVSSPLALGAALALSGLWAVVYRDLASASARAVRTPLRSGRTALAG